MTDPSDPLEMLRSANPVRQHELPDADSRRAKALYEEITTMHKLARTAQTVRSRRRRLLIPLVAMAGLPVIAAGAYAIASQRATTTASLACYETASLRADTAVVDADGRAPVEICADAWRSGAFGELPAPALQACLLPSGVAGVFPAAEGEDVCAKLGLPRLAEPDPNGDDKRFLAFKAAAVERFISRSCLDRQQATAVVQDELARAGLQGWTIDIGPGVRGEGFSPDRPCASLAFNQPDRRVVLVPTPVAP